MKNTYLIGHFPLISIILFSLSFGLYGEMEALILIQKIGIYKGMLEFLSKAEIKLALLLVIFLLFFMLFSALKLISDTAIEVSLLFFSKDSDGNGLKRIRMAAVIFAAGGAVSLVSVQSITGLAAIFLGTAFIAFIYFVFAVSPNLSMPGMIGLIFFHTIIWALFILLVAYSSLKLYNSIMNSLPI
ncbi:hypothetical protein SAMN05443252_102606 [Bacillus sp. OV322]|uniref:DUF5366 family protein n=1 Tax=Bacillus sp. OV322 TaxID=1882764 RepID=UPI0008DEF416|nr:DUF5366 family protein [Bacillus sp. OV322]SFC29600.1 hypothetical protein SAMN05443252_102606 [Bacillus sp. OV322]